jgi:hypothetical protein
MTLLRYQAVFITLLALSGGAGAAPPTVDALFPAGASVGTKTSITVTGKWDRWPTRVWVDGAGVTAVCDKAAGKLNVSVAPDARPGVYRVRLHDSDGASVSRPFFVGTLPEVMEKEPNDDPKKPQPIDGPNAVVNGRLGKAGDVDTFAVKLTAGQTLVAALEANHALRSPMDGVLQVLSADGFVLDQNDDHVGMDPLVAYHVPKDGTYLVRAFAFPATPDSSIRFSGGDKFLYRLTLTTRPFVDYALPLGLPHDKAGELHLFGWNLPAKTLTLGPAADDWRFVHQPGWANSVALSRDTKHPATVFHAADGQPQKVTIPATIAGRFHKRGETQTVEFAGKKGQKLSLVARSRSIDFAAEPAFNITDAAGKVLASGTPGKLGADATAAVTLPADGTYRVQVRDLHDMAGWRSVYQLDVAPVVADFRLTVATDRFRLVPGTPLEIPVTVDRRGGFGGDVTLAVEGADDLGAKVESARKDAKTITLKLTAKAGGPSRPIRIVGTAKGAVSPQPARATIAELAYTTDRLWLTVAAAAKK